MDNTHDSPQLDKALRALSNQKRRGIVHDLSLQPATVGQIARSHQLSLPAIHKHIQVLENADLIIRKKIGRTNFIALNNKTLLVVQAWIVQYKTGWGNSEASLENYVSRMRQ
jgi:DNA-binding transcriptional ArsR family regulator